tara:strand:- start:44 stop:487 length:444 start_codon:yes stop_codon:yes gene_type:complete
MAQVNTGQWVDKFKTLTHQEELANTYKQGAGDALKNIKDRGLTIAGKGGSPGQPYDDPEKGKGPFVPPPKKASLNNNMMIAHEGHTPESTYNEKYHKDLKISQSPAALGALRKGTTPGLSSQQIRNLIEPYTKQDQFGHPTGSLRGV